MSTDELLEEQLREDPPEELSPQRLYEHLIREPIPIHQLIILDSRHRQREIHTLVRMIPGLLKPCIVDGDTSRLTRLRLRR